MNKRLHVFLAATAFLSLSLPARSMDENRLFDALSINHTAVCLVNYGKFDMKYVSPFIKKSLQLKGMTWDDYEEATKSPSWSEDKKWLWRQKGGVKGCERAIQFFTELLEENGYKNYRN